MPPAERTKSPRPIRSSRGAVTAATRRRRDAPQPTLVLLVRHGVTPSTGKVMPGRAPGLHLSEAGKAQAERAAERIATLAPAPVAVYASPMERTRETAAPIARLLGLRVRTERGLLDCAVGEWEGKSLKTLARRPEWRTVMSWPTGFRFPGGESFPETLDRVVGTILSLAEEHRGGRFVVVSHADPIKMFLSAAAGLPLDMFQRFTISPGSISAVLLADARPVVLCMNSTASLTELVPA